MLCPCCGKENVTQLSVINSGEIIKLYRKNNINTEDVFTYIPLVSYLHCKNCELKFFRPAAAGNENFYNQLQQLDWYFLHDDKTEFNYTKNHVCADYTVLDVGSGRGVWATHLKDIPGVFYQGIEFSSKSIELAKKDGINVMKESVEDHAKKYPDYYDVVATFQVLEHIDNIREFMSACIACTKPGGKLVIAVPNNDGFIKNMINNWLNIPPHHINHWNEASLRKLGEQFKLKMEDLYKEKVTPVHKMLFYNIYVFGKLNKLIGFKSELVNNSLKFRILNKLSYWIAKIIMPFSKAHLKSNGHTIIAVFEK